jgi:hypothetical protein
LPEGVLGNGVGEPDGPEALVRRDPLGHPGHQRLTVDLTAGHHDRDRDLAVGGVGAGDDGGVGDRGVAEQQRLQLGGGHLVGADLDELLEPVGAEHVAVVVDPAEVAGVQPAAGVERLGGRRGVVQVALHDLRPPDPQLARLAGAEVGAGGGVVTQPAEPATRPRPTAPLFRSGDPTLAERVDEA